MHFQLQDLSQINSTLLDLLTKNLPDMLWIKNLNGTYIYANKAICDGLLMAKNTEEPIGKDDVFFALREREKHKDNPNWHTFGELCFNSDQVVIDANKAMKFEEYGNVKGKLLYLEVNKAPFYDENGNIIGTVGSGRDITKLKMTQFKLSEQAQIIEQIHDCIITTDIKGKIVSWNRSAKKLFNYTKNEVINKNINILFRKENHKEIENYINILFEKGKFSTKINFLSKSNQIIITEVTLSLLKDKDEKIIRIIYYIKDITDKEKLNEEIKKQENIITNQAHHVSMGEMIGNIAHQWRQPLSVISAASTGLLIQKELNTLSDEILIDSCKAIERNTQYLSDTIDDFRSFIKGDRNKTLFNLTNTIESFLKLMESTIKKYHIIIILDLEENIIIDGYSNDLMQCLINIFNNSKDAFLEKKVENNYIFIKSSKNNNKVEILFKDNAKGIPKKILSKIFDPYFTTKYKEKGTGIGLYMTYKIITEGMTGKIKVSNIKYKYNNKNHTGAEFNILLPL